MKVPGFLPGTELKLGDVIRSGNFPYSTATVSAIKDGRVKLFRPYVHTADFSCGNSVICYIGLEEWETPANSYTLWEVLDRVELR